MQFSGNMLAKKCYDPLLNVEILRLVKWVPHLKKYVIVPKESEKNDIIKFYYEKFKREGSRKLVNRIGDMYLGISRKDIQQWLNSNEDHCKKKPIFCNKPPLQPIIAREVQELNQIDLVNLEKYKVIVNEESYSWVLSVLDVFSRFLHLRALTGRDSNQVLHHLKDIYR